MTRRHRAADEPHPTPLGTLIRERRERAGLTVKMLAEYLSMQPATLTHIETGRTKTVTPADAKRLAAVLPVTVREIARAIGWDIEDEADLIGRLHRVRELSEELARTAFQVNPPDVAP